MNAETNEKREESVRLSTEQEAEIGDILLSARAVSRQMILQAQEQIDDMMRKAEEQAAEKLSEAEKQAAQITREAEEQAAEKLREAEERAAQILQGAMEEKYGEAPGSEEQTEAEAAAETETDVQPEEAVRGKRRAAGRDAGVRGALCGRLLCQASPAAAGDRGFYQRAMALLSQRPVSARTACARRGSVGDGGNRRHPAGYRGSRQRYCQRAHGDHREITVSA